MDKFRLTLLSLGHGCVDAVAAMVTPLMLVFQQRFDLQDTTASLLLTAMSLGASLAQPLFAYLSDRIARGWLVLIGPWLATVCIAIVAIMPSFVWVAFCVLVAGLGVAAFHPEAAVMAGQYAGRRRALGVGVLVCGGLAGLSLGPAAVSYLVEYEGLERLYLLALPGLVLLPLLAGYLRPADRVASRPSAARAPGGFFGRRPGLVGLLFSMSVIRAGVVVGYQADLAFLAKANGLPLTTVGLWISTYLFSGGLAGLVTSLFVRRGFEKWPSVIAFAIAAPAMAAFAWCWHMPVVGLVVLAVAGAASQANVPLFISTCQRLMPRGEAMASALMMGVSWGIGGACPLLVALANTWCGQQATIVGLGVLLAPTAVLALWLPGVPSGLGDAFRNRVDYRES